jgi:uncharacterized protein (DUF1778 family)
MQDYTTTGASHPSFVVVVAVAVAAVVVNRQNDFILVEQKLGI